jgi:predicted XRE-type DNA-binding protein
MDSGKRLNHDQIGLKLNVSMNVVSDIVHQRFDKFTVDRLIYLVIRTGQLVKFVITGKDK